MANNGTRNDHGQNERRGRESLGLVFFESRVGMNRRKKLFLKKKLLSSSLYNGAVQGHLIERSNSERNGKMPRAFVNVMRNVQPSISRVVDVSAMLTSSVTETFASLSNVGSVAVCADEHVDHVFSFAVHFLLNFEQISIFHLN